MTKAIASFSLAFVAALATTVAGAANGGTSPICTRGNTSVEVDPRGLLPLTGANPIGPATAAALRFSTPANKPQVTSARLARFDQLRGPQARFACGTRTWQRTIVVYVTDRAFVPAISASARGARRSSLRHGADDERARRRADRRGARAARASRRGRRRGGAHQPVSALSGGAGTVTVTLACTVFSAPTARAVSVCGPGCSPEAFQPSV